MTNEMPSQLNDAALTKELLRLASDEREATVRLILHLAEFDARRLYLGAGFSSLFVYCREVLRLSEHESYTRIEAARAARAFPTILALLEEGAINLTTIRLLAPYLKSDTGDELLVQAKHGNKREVEELIALRFPRPDVATLIRREPEKAHGPAVPASPAPSNARFGDPVAGSVAGLDLTGPTIGPVATTGVSLGAATGAVGIQGVSRPSRADVVSLAFDRYLVRFMAGGKTREKLRRAQELLRHSIPDGDLGQVMDRALDLLLDKLLREKVGAARSSRTRASTGMHQGSRHIPGPVRRAVWLRDAGRCAFIASAGGRRCLAQSLLEFHHRKPFGVGGEATVENIELRCRAHNQFEARLFYGPPREVLPAAIGTGHSQP